MRILMQQFLLVLAALFCIASQATAIQEESASSKTRDTKQQEKLTAFAKTFGYVRYFHPSDQAALVDWDKMAIFGVQQILESPDTEPTEEALRKIFGPLVVDLEFYRGEKKPEPELVELPIGEVLAWQHVGVGVGGQNSLYRSARTNRAREVTRRTLRSGNAMQRLPARELRGKEIRLRFQARADHPSCRLQGWLRVDRASRERGLFDNMGDRPIVDDQWQEYEITGTVDDDARSIVFGVMLTSGGSGLVDQVTMEVKEGDTWTAVEIRNASFEDGDVRPAAWITRGDGFRFTVDTEDVVDGEQALRIERASATTTRAILPFVPKMGEVIDSQLVGDLRVRMPLVLQADNSYNAGDDAQVDQLIERINKTEVDVEQNELCLANVVIAWNLFQHFYPYFEQVDADWPATLQTSLNSGINTVSRADTTRTLQWLVAQLHDGHGRVMDPQAMQGVKFLPVSFDWIEEQLVAVASNDGQLKVGDVITTVNGTPADEYLTEREALISGSPQWKRHRSLSEISMSNMLESIELQVQRQDESLEATIEFGSERPPRPEQREMVDVVEEGENPEDRIYYVDLGRVTPEDVRPLIKDFASARGIIFDLRGYPKGTQFLFQHLTDQHMQSAKWQVPRQIRPDRVDISEIETMGRWEMPPEDPRFQGKFVFITNGSAISYAESCMAIIAHYQLAEIIGSPTAGANGNVNPFGLPGGYRVSWTGMRVMNHDDSQHHVRGVQPTIPMQPTLKGILEGRDELFEKAREIIQAEVE
ncbi:MAG: S41 family peptidase [Pirellulaceae bacterium]